MSLKTRSNGPLIGGTTSRAEPVTIRTRFETPVRPKLRAAIFADAGSLWNYTGATIIPSLPAPAVGNCLGSGSINATGNVCLADSGLIRTSVGASLIWASPFGPLRFDYAFALTKEPWDKLQSFRFGGMSRF